MAELNLSKYGITGTTEVVHNPSYDLLFEEETKSTNEGYEKGQVSELGAVNVMTGIYTGRSPKDKYIVMDENSKNTVWWTSEGYKNDNHPMTESTWASVKDLAIKELSNKKLYVVDAFCGANKDTRMAVRFIVEVAWQAHFVKNMFIQPSEEELKNFTPDFVVYNASKAKVENYKELGLNSETCVAFNITSREQVILNTWYGGEMKKGMFSMMNVLQAVSFHASLPGDHHPGKPHLHLKADGLPVLAVHLHRDAFHLPQPFQQLPVLQVFYSSTSDPAPISAHTVSQKSTLLRSASRSLSGAFRRSARSRLPRVTSSSLRARSRAACISILIHPPTEIPAGNRRPSTRAGCPS